VQSAKKGPTAAQIRYSNKKSKLQAKTTQAAIDELSSKSEVTRSSINELSAKSDATRSTVNELSIDVGGAVSGQQSGAVRALAATTLWTGFQYYYAGNIPGNQGPAETLRKSAVTITFTPTTKDTGTLTITPVNFVCEIEAEFQQNGSGVCGTFGDTFTYTYTIFGANLFVENGRTSDGLLIGQGVMGGAGAGNYLEIQNQGGSKLVLRYQDLVTTVYDLSRSN
jgi:hypothetical protein